MKKLKRKQIFIGFCGFLAFMLVGSCISRGIYGSRLARVGLGSASMSGITHTVTGNGTIVGGTAHQIYLAAGLRVEKVHIMTGAAVKEGETLLTLDMEDLQEKYAQAEWTLQYEQTRLSDLKYNRSHAGEGGLRDEAGLLLQEHTVETAEKMLAEYQALVDTEGRVVSAYSGVIESVSVRPGDETSESAALVVIDEGDGWQFVGKVTKEERKYVNAGDALRLELSGSGRGYIETEVLSVAAGADENGMYELRAKLDSGDYSYGQTGSFTMIKANDENACSIPLSALYSDNEGSYVLVITEENTFFGTELRAIRRSVTVMDKNDTNAALFENPLTTEEKIIITSDRAVAPNDIVREEEL